MDIIGRTRTVYFFLLYKYSLTGLRHIKNEVAYFLLLYIWNRQMKTSINFVHFLSASTA